MLLLKRKRLKQKEWQYLRLELPTLNQIDRMTKDGNNEKCLLRIDLEQSYKTTNKIH